MAGSSLTTGELKVNVHQELACEHVNGVHSRLHLGFCPGTLAPVLLHCGRCATSAHAVELQGAAVAAAGVLSGTTVSQFAGSSKAVEVPCAAAARADVSVLWPLRGGEGWSLCGVAIVSFQRLCLPLFCRHWQGTRMDAACRHCRRSRPTCGCRPVHLLALLRQPYCCGCGPCCDARTIGSVPPHGTLDAARQRHVPKRATAAAAQLPMCWPASSHLESVGGK